MPEYLAPGVYVEETSFRQKSIEGVSTSTTGFVGATRFGPTTGEPELLTSFLDFERIYGGIDRLDRDGTLVHNDVAHAVRAFFENGGQRLYVSRAYDPSPEAPADANTQVPVDHGHYTLPTGLSAASMILQARYPGEAGNFLVTIDVKVGQNICGQTGPVAASIGILRGGQVHDTVLVSPTQSAPGAPELCVLARHVTAEGLETLALVRDGTTVLVASELDPADTEVRVVTLTVTVARMGQFMLPRTWEEIGPDPQHRDGLARVFAPNPASRPTELFVPLVVRHGTATGVEVLEAIVDDTAGASSLAVDAAQRLVDTLLDPPAGAAPGQIQLQRELEHGSDGGRPPSSSYEGDADPTTSVKSGLLAFEDLEDISIVAAPGSTRQGADWNAGDSRTIQDLLISHCHRMRYRVAVLDSVEGHLVSDVRAYRGQMDSTHAALYYPWVRIQDPVTRDEITVPPSGFVAGVYARNDVERGVHKAPANEVVRLAIGLEHLLNKGQQDVLNPEGVNCLRFFEGRGYRVWGGRTISSDPEWKYLNLRRYFAYVERSIDKGTQWSVFEPNGHLLWAKVRRTIEDFLFNEWVSGRLMGESPDEAYFVRCDRSTMTQSDFDNGRLICLIGLSPLRPAEFIVFRVGQKTLDFKP